MTKKTQKTVKKGSKIGFFRRLLGLFNHMDLGQYFFLVPGPNKSIGIIIGMKKAKFSIFVKIIFFF